MNKGMLLIFTNLVLVSTTSAIEPSFRKNSIGIDWGFNYYGNTFSISYEHRFSEKWSTGLGYSRGIFSFQHKAHTTMFGISYEGDYDLWIDLHIKRFLDFMVYYHRTTGKNFRFIGKFGFGISHYYVTFEESMVMTETGWEFRGKKDFVNSAFLVSANIVEYKPKKFEALFFSFGAKVHYTILDSPHTMTLYYDNITWDLKLTNSLGFNQIVYPQVYFKINFSF